MRPPLSGADLVALQEVEHYGAARRLVDLELDGLGYRHVVWLPDPHNTTGPVLLSKLPVRRVGALWVDSSSPVDGPDDGLKDGLNRPLRPILEVEVALGDAADAPSLFLFNNHWKSKQGGTAETEVYRRRAAALLAARLDEIIAADPAAEILVVGDLNETIDEYARQGRRYVTALMPAPAPDAAGVLRVTGTIPPTAPPLELFSPWLSYPPHRTTRPEQQVVAPRCRPSALGGASSDVAPGAGAACRSTECPAVTRAQALLPAPGATYRQRPLNSRR